MYCTITTCGHKARFVIQVEDKFLGYTMKKGYCNEHADCIPSAAAYAKSFFTQDEAEVEEGAVA